MANSKILLKTFPDLIQYHKELPIDYFEVPVRPVVQGEKMSFEEQMELFAPISEKIIGIHGAIYREGVNLCDPAAKQANLDAFNYVKRAGEVFKNSEYILFHPGHMISNSACSFETLFSFLDSNAMPKLMIEFEPFFSYQSRLVFPMHSVSDWLKFQQRIRLPIVLDTAHCFITAQALRYDYVDYFFHLVDVLNPKVIHISQTDMSDGGYNDKHLNLNKGCIEFEKIRPCFEGRTLVIEVNGVEKEDIFYLENLVELITV